MTTVVSFVTPGSAGGSGANGVNKIRAQERITVPGTTTNVSAVGEIIIVGNGEASMVAVAFGTTPDAAAAADNSPVTTAGFPVGAGQVSAPLVPGIAGAKVNIKIVT
jgi:hypothetical protein